MKASERHDLATNELASGLNQWMQKAKPYISYVLIVAVLAAFGIYYYVNKTEQRAQTDQAALFSLVRAETAGRTGQMPTNRSEAFTKEAQSLDSFASEYADTSLVPLAKLNMASRYYDAALMQWAEGADAAKCDATMTQAETIFGELSKRQDQIGLEAQFGLACTMVERGTGLNDKAKLEEGKRMLAALIDSHKGTGLAGRAQKRLDVLSDTRAPVFSPEPPAAMTSLPAVAPTTAEPVIIPSPVTAEEAAPATAETAAPAKQE